MKNKDKLIIKISKSVIVVFGVLTVFNVIMLINKKSYALFQKTVKTDTIIHIETANEFPSENKGSVDELKEKTSDGIQGVDPEKGEVCTENCKEYRYSGTNVNNYVYFNCEPNQEQNANNCEMWRIVGVFKDDNNEEHLKIVKNDVLTADMFPETYTHGGTIYNIKNSSGNYAYWNGIMYEINNDWTRAGLQYWLNGEDEDGYLGQLKTGVKDMIADTTYYLGSVVGNDTPKTAYQHERDVKQCVDNISTEDLKEGCYVWKGNKATWEGKVGLLYPSDYGFSADSSNWNTVLYNYENASSSSWLQSANHSSYNEWLLSPTIEYSYSASIWGEGGYVDDGFVFNSGNGVRPSLNLKSNVEISGGTGEETDPYTLILN